MSSMGLLASLTLWIYISTTTALSVSGGLNFLVQPLIAQDLSVAQITAIHHIIQGEDPVNAERNEGSDVLTELQKVQAVLQEMQAKDATINHTLTTHEAELDRYKDEVATLTGKIHNQESVIQGLQNFSNTLPDEFATLTGIIQDQQSVIEGLQNFSNTLPDELDGLSQSIIDQQNQTKWLKMQYNELKNTSDCEHDGSVYKHGEDDGCYYKCYNGAMKMIFNQTTGNQCVGPFDIFEGNCYYFNQTFMTWSEARKACVARGGDLATDNFNTLKAFYNTKGSGHWSWIGVRDNLWLNGQPPQQQQWVSGDPNAQDQCGCMHPDGLVDFPCHHRLPSICQLY